MRKYLPSIFIFIFIINFNMAFGQEYYRSNSIGMVFEKIPSSRINDYQWVLELLIDGFVETRTIYFEGVEKRKIEYLREGDALRINEYVSDNLVHAEYHENGLIINEKYFEEKSLNKEYIYQWSNRQLQKATYLENGELIYEDTFITDNKSHLKQIRRLYVEGNMSFSGFSYTDTGLLSGWYSRENDFLLYRYRKGKVVNIENWQNGIISSTKIFTHSDSGSIVTETDIINGKVIVQVFDLNDRILSEEVRQGESVKKSIFLYEENLLVQKEISASGLREKHFYSYDSDRSIFSERIFKDSMLTKEIFFKLGNKDIEKLYKDGSLILIVSYKDGEKISEEQIR